jgi:hypothetical protein
MAQHIILNINDNQGYSPEQVVGSTITLQDLLEAVEQAIADKGGDTKVVLSNGQRYGAQYGTISQWDNIFAEQDQDED